MEDWQLAVLNDEHIRIDQSPDTGYRLVIRKTDSKHDMMIQDVVETVRHSKRKPVIMYPDDPFRGMFADKQEVLAVLMARGEYVEYVIWKKEVEE